MIYYLDTDTVSLAEREHPTVLRRLLEHDSSEIVTTVITVHEQITGRFNAIQKANTPQALAAAYQQFADTFTHLRELPIVGFSHAAILRFENLLKLKLNVGKNDLRIAAIVLEADGILVTRNKRDFERVPELRIEDWSQEETQ